MINKWNFQTPTEEELHKRDRLASQLGLSPVVCLLLVQRGLTTVEEVKKFFKPSLNDLHDPFLMPDMEKAVKRLNKALGNKEKILIYGQNENEILYLPAITSLDICPTCFGSDRNR